MNPEGKITIRRVSTYTDRARAYKVMLDGSEIGRVKNGRTESFTVPAGTHQLQMKIDWATSPPYRFDLAPGEEARLLCRPKANALTVLYYATLARKKYLILEEDRTPSA